MPAVTLTLQGAVTIRGNELAEAGEIELATKPPISATEADATTSNDVNRERIDRVSLLFLFAISYFYPCLLEEVTTHFIKLDDPLETIEIGSIIVFTRCTESISVARTCFLQRYFASCAGHPSVLG